MEEVDFSSADVSSGKICGTCRNYIHDSANSKVIPFQNSSLNNDSKTTYSNNREEQETEFITSSYESCGSWTRLANYDPVSSNQHLCQQWKEEEKYLQNLHELAEGKLITCHNNDSINNDQRVCSLCVERVASALEQDIKRLEFECQAYEDTLHEMETAVAVQKESVINSNESKEEESGAISWKQTYEATLKENKRLTQLLFQEWIRATQLTDMESTLLHQFTQLKLDSTAFMEIQASLATQANQLHSQLKNFEQVPFLLPQLFSVHYDGQNKVYLNGARLMHKPMSSNFSAGWTEVNSAWAQASMLLLSVSAMVEFPTTNLRIVPLLSSCAKIIQFTSTGKKNIYHLGCDEPITTNTPSLESINKTKNIGDMWKNMRGIDTIVPSLRIFHTLLHQIVTHVESKVYSSVRDKVPITSTTMGDNNIYETQDQDDRGWLSIIYGMASNLKWLVQNAESLAPAL